MAFDLEVAFPIQACCVPEDIARQIASDVLPSPARKMELVEQKVSGNDCYIQIM
jgi:hypothetical protein